MAPPAPAPGPEAEARTEARAETWAETWAEAASRPEPERRVTADGVIAEMFTHLAALVTTVPVRVRRAESESGRTGPPRWRSERLKWVLHGKFLFVGMR